MIIYFITAVISSVLLGIYSKNTKNKLFLVLSFLPLFFISAFRYGIGYDYLAVYVPMFNNIANGLSVAWDIGTIMLCKVISIFTKDYLYFFVVTSFIVLYFTYKGILCNSDIPALSVFLFVTTGAYISSMNTLRQYMAIAIFMYAIQFIIKKDFRKYLLYIILAGFLHTSAFFLLPFYFINRLKIDIKKQIIVGIVLVLFLPFITNMFFSILEKTKYVNYIGTNYDDYNPTYSELILSTILYVVSTFFYKKEKDNKKFLVFYNLVFIYFIISILSFKIMLAYRLIMYFKIIQILMIPTLAKSMSNAKQRVVFIVCWILLYSSVTLVGGYYFKWYDVNYVSIFSERYI